MRISGDANEEGYIYTGRRYYPIYTIHFNGVDLGGHCITADDIAGYVRYELLNRDGSLCIVKGHGIMNAEKYGDVKITTEYREEDTIKDVLLASIMRAKHYLFGRSQSA